MSLPIDIDIFYFTVLSGGFSVTLDAKRPETGYMVALPDTEQIVPFADFSLTHIREYRELYILLLEQPNRYLGTWVDTATNKVYFDVSENVIDLTTATELGIARNQLAIFDVAACESIYLGNDQV